MHGGDSSFVALVWVIAVQVLVPVLVAIFVRIFAALPIKRMRRITLMLQPALPKKVSVPIVGRPTVRHVAKDPTVHVDSP